MQFCACACYEDKTLALKSMRAKIISFFFFLYKLRSQRYPNRVPQAYVQANPTKTDGIG